MGKDSAEFAPPATGNPTRTWVGPMRTLCPLSCDLDCEAVCHWGHVVVWQRRRHIEAGTPGAHHPEDCPARLSNTSQDPTDDR